MLEVPSLIALDTAELSFMPGVANIVRPPGPTFNDEDFSVRLQSLKMTKNGRPSDPKRLGPNHNFLGCQRFR